MTRKSTLILQVIAPAMFIIAWTIIGPMRGPSLDEVGGVRLVCCLATEGMDEEQATAAAQHAAEIIALRLDPRRQINLSARCVGPGEIVVEIPRPPQMALRRQARYQSLLAALAEWGADVGELQTALALGGQRRHETIAALTEAHPEWRDMLEELSAVYDSYSPHLERLMIADPETLQRLLVGRGLLSLRVIPRHGDVDLSPEQLNRYQGQLSLYGLSKEWSNSAYVWREPHGQLALPPDAVTGEYEGVLHVLAANSEDHKVVFAAGETPVIHAYVDTDSRGEWTVNVKFSADAAERIWEFTSANRGRPTAILVDEYVVSVPEIRTPIRRQAVLAGDFTQRAALELAHKLNAEPLPAPLEASSLSFEVVPPPGQRAAQR